MTWVFMRASGSFPSLPKNRTFRTPLPGRPNSYPRY